jgi:hypothetical protein
MYLSNIWLIGNINLWNYIHIDPKYLLLPSVEKSKKILWPNIRPLSYVLRNKLPPALRSRSRLNLMECGGELFLRTTILYHPTLPYLHILHAEQLMGDAVSLQLTSCLQKCSNML